MYHKIKLFLFLLLPIPSIVYSQPFASQTIAQNHFIMHYSSLSGGVTQPFAAAGGARLLGSRLKWNDVQFCSNPNADGSCPSTPGFTWTTFDKVVTALVNAKTDPIIIPAYFTPRWASSAPDETSAETCPSYGAWSTPGSTQALQFSGGCYPPTDLALDGSGTDSLYQTYLTNLLAHVHTTFPNTHFWIEMWNEPGGGSTWNPGQWNLVPLVRMTADAATLVHAYSASDGGVYKVLAPPQGGANLLGVAGACTSAGGHATGSYYIVNCTWVGSTYAGHTIKDYADLFPYHWYPGTGNGNNPEASLSSLANIVTQANIQGINVSKIFVGEGGWAMNSNLTDPELQASYTWRWNLLQIPYSFASSWYQYDNTYTTGDWGTLLNTTGVDSFTQAGKAYIELIRKLTGKTVNACTVSGTVYSCVITDPYSSTYQGLIVWDKSTTCTPCTTTSYTPTSTYIRYTDIYGVETLITTPGTTVVQIGARPLYFDNIKIGSTARTDIDFGPTTYNQGPQKIIAGGRYTYHIQPMSATTVSCDHISNSCYSAEYIPQGTEAEVYTDSYGFGGDTTSVNAIRTEVWELHPPIYHIINVGTGGTNHFQLSTNGTTPITLNETVIMRLYNLNSYNAYLPNTNGIGWPTGTTITYYNPGIYATCLNSVYTSTPNFGPLSWGTIKSYRCAIVSIPVDTTPGTYNAGWRFCQDSNATQACRDWTLPIQIIAPPVVTAGSPPSFPAMPSVFNVVPTLCMADPENQNFTLQAGTDCSWPTLTSHGAGSVTQAGIDKYCPTPSNPDLSYELAGTPIYMFFSSTGGAVGGIGSEWYYEGGRVLHDFAEYMGDEKVKNCARYTLNRYANLDPGAPNTVGPFYNATQGRQDAKYNSFLTNPFNVGAVYQEHAKQFLANVGDYNNGQYASTSAWVKPKWNAQMAAAIWKLYNNSLATNGGGSIGTEREMAYSLMILNSIYSIGKRGPTIMSQYHNCADSLISLVLQWYNPAKVSRYDVGPVGAQTFMKALVAESLWDYYDNLHDARVPYVIGLILNEVRTTYDFTKHVVNWDPATSGPWCASSSVQGVDPRYSFYINGADMEGNCNTWVHPEINGMMSSHYARMWATFYPYLGSNDYQTFADELFIYSIQGSYPTAGYRFTGKALNQEFKYYFDYVKWRQGR